MSDAVMLEKCYILMQWLSERIARFPKDHKYTLGNRMSGALYEFFEGCVYLYGEADLRGLKRLSRKLDILRYYTRLAKDLKILSLDQYGFAAEHVNELGRLMGGWINSFKSKRIAASATDGTDAGPV